MAQDLALFVVFFDLMLVPFFFLTGGWGARRTACRRSSSSSSTRSSARCSCSPRRSPPACWRRATSRSPSRSSDLGAARGCPTGSQEWIFLCFAAAFLVKMPAFPLHGWMPDGYRAMPLPVLAVFSGVLSKVAAYGFLRVVLPLYPDAQPRTSRSSCC